MSHSLGTINFEVIQVWRCPYFSIYDYRSATELFEAYSMAAMTFNPPVETSSSKKKVCDTFHYFFLKMKLKLN